jgi:hypothetical protein
MIKINVKVKDNKYLKMEKVQHIIFFSFLNIEMHGLIDNSSIQSFFVRQ